VGAEDPRSATLRAGLCYRERPAGVGTPALQERMAFAARRLQFRNGFLRFGRNDRGGERGGPGRRATGRRQAPAPREAAAAPAPHGRRLRRTTGSRQAPAPREAAAARDGQEASSCPTGGGCAACAGWKPALPRRQAAGGGNPFAALRASSPLIRPIPFTRFCRCWR